MRFPLILHWQLSLWFQNTLLYEGVAWCRWSICSRRRYSSIPIVCISKYKSGLGACEQLLVLLSRVCYGFSFGLRLVLCVNDFPSSNVLFTKRMRAWFGSACEAAIQIQFVYRNINHFVICILSACIACENNHFVYFDETSCGCSEGFGEKGDGWSARDIVVAT